MAKRNVDYAFKSYVLKEHSDLLKKAKVSTNIEYYRQLLEREGIVCFHLKHDNESMNVHELYDYCIENNLVREFFECYKINNASYKRTKRLRERIERMLVNGRCLFLTLTFSDESLQNTSEKERRVAVTRYLKTFNSPYIANVDYGAKNHREHYHAVIQCDSIKLDTWRKYGNINVERIRNRNIKSDNVKLAKYICKLSNHAIKETTKRSTLIYSR